MTPPLAPGARVGEYVLERPLGRGGMGAVFVARHTTSGARHALKVLLVDAGPRAAERRERFAREARALARLDRHPGVVRIHAHGIEPDGLAWCALDLVEGGDLAARLAGGPLPLAEALAIAHGVAEALAHVHAAGVVHRDLKPGNVLLPGGGRPPVLTDFGVARDASEERLTRTAELVGTPHGMSPEQATGARDVGPPSDVWSLGVLLFELLTGAPPFEGRSLTELVAAIVSAEAPALRMRRPDAPPDLEALAARCLEKDRARRPTAAAVAAALGALRRGEPARLARPPAGRLPRGLVAGGAALIALALVGAGGAGAAAALRTRAARAREAARIAEEAQARRALVDAASRAWRLGGAPAPPDPAPLAAALAGLHAAGAAAAAAALEEALARLEVERALAAGDLAGAAAGLPRLAPPTRALLAAHVAARAGDDAGLAAALEALPRRGEDRAEALLAGALAAAARGDGAGARSRLLEARAAAGRDAPPALEGALRRAEAAALGAEAAAAAAALDAPAAARALRAARGLDAGAAEAATPRAVRAALAAGGAAPRGAVLAVLDALWGLGPFPPEAAGPWAAEAEDRRVEVERAVEVLDRARRCDPTRAPSVGFYGTVQLRVSALCAGSAREEERGLALLLAATRAGLPVDLAGAQLARLQAAGRFDARLAADPGDWAARLWRARGVADPRGASASPPPERARAALDDLGRVLADPDLAATARVDATLHALALALMLDPGGAHARCLEALAWPGADRRAAVWLAVEAARRVGLHATAAAWARRLLRETEAHAAAAATGALPPGVVPVGELASRHARAYEFLCEGLRDGGDVDGAEAAAREYLARGLDDAGAHLELARCWLARGDRARARAALAAHDDARGARAEPELARDLRAQLAAQDGGGGGR